MRDGRDILGNWTHRRGDVGGSRAVVADLGKARPRVAWMHRPPAGGRLDQVRIAHDRIYAVSMAMPDPHAPGWEHATVCALDAATGRVVAERRLPDPVPVAAMMIEGDVVHVLATRHGEPVFWYALDAWSLRPRHRRTLRFGAGSIERGARWDVLDSWASSEGGVWLELDGGEAPGGGPRRRAYGYARGDEVWLVPEAHDVAHGEHVVPHDACCIGQSLFAPRAGSWSLGGEAMPPSVWQLDAGALVPPADDACARAGLMGPRSHAHAVAAEGEVTAIAVAEDPTRPGRMMVQSLFVDGESGALLTQSEVGRFAVTGDGGVSARVVRRAQGEVLVQRIGADGDPASDVWRVSPTGELSSTPLPNRKLVMDAALGSSVLGHHESRNGLVVSALEIDREGRLLGRRATTAWTIEAPDLGGGATVYAGAGHVVARGQQGLAAIRLAS